MTPQTEEDARAHDFARRYLACEHHVETLWRLAEVAHLTAQGVKASVADFDLTQDEADGLIELAFLVAKTARELRDTFHGPKKLDQQQA